MEVLTPKTPIPMTATYRVGQKTGPLFIFPNIYTTKDNDFCIHQGQCILNMCIMCEFTHCIT